MSQESLSMCIGMDLKSQARRSAMDLNPYRYTSHSRKEITEDTTQQEWEKRWCSQRSWQNSSTKHTYSAPKMGQGALQSRDREKSNSAEMIAVPTSAKHPPELAPHCWSRKYLNTSPFPMRKHSKTSSDSREWREPEAYLHARARGDGVRSPGSSALQQQQQRGHGKQRMHGSLSSREETSPLNPEKF